MGWAKEPPTFWEALWVGDYHSSQFRPNILYSLSNSDSYKSLFQSFASCVSKLQFFCEHYEGLNITDYLSVLSVHIGRGSQQHNAEVTFSVNSAHA